MPSAEITSATRSPREPAADQHPPHPRGLRLMTSGHQLGIAALVHDDAVDCSASVQPRPSHSRGPAACHAAARWLRRALADCARSWALAAGVPPNLPPDW